MRLPRGTRPDRVVILSFEAAALFAAWVLFGGGTPAARTAFSDLIFPVVGLAAASQAWRAARNPRVDPGTRRAWSLITGAYLCWFAGDTVWAGYELVFHQKPFPSWADAGYLLFYPLILAGLLTLPGIARTRTDRFKLAVDTGTVVLAGALVVWYVVIDPTVRDSSGGGLARMLSLAYPVGDVLLIFGVAWTVLRRPAVRTGALAALICGALSFVFADVAFAHLSLTLDEVGVGLPDILWMTGVLSLLVAGNLQAKHTAPRDTAVRRTRVARVSKLPYAGIAIGYGLLLLVAGRQAQTPLSGLIFGCAGITVLVTMRQVTAQREYVQLMARFRSLAQTDSLTGLSNRRNFFELAEDALAASRATDASLAVVMIDVDHFKRVNDTLGHAAGDDVLAAVSAMLADAVRGNDTVARFGGDEFAVLLPGSGIAEARVVAERLHRRAMACPVETAAGPVEISLSVGVAALGARIADIETLLLRADEALYDAKHAGRGCVRVSGAA